MNQIFVEHGIPSNVTSDNGPQFSAETFARFAKQWNFVHITSSPRYPRSNGFIERHVRTVKATMTKSLEAKTDLDLALLCLRTTPISTYLPSPIEILTGKKAKANIPTSIADNNATIDHERVREELQHRQGNPKIHCQVSHYPAPTHSRAAQACSGQ